METVTLKATPRTENGKGPARRLRAAGHLPVVAYGAGMSTQPLSIERNHLKDILTSARGRNTLIDLSVDGAAGTIVMVKDYVVHPVSRKLLHADLVKISETTPVVCEVPFRTTGKSKGEAAGGTLLSNIRSLKVRCLPTSIPDEVSFDVTDLVIDDEVTVGQLATPPGTEILLAKERKVLIIVPPRVIEVAEEEEAAPAEGEEAAAPAEEKKEKS